MAFIFWFEQLLFSKVGITALQRNGVISLTKCILPTQKSSEAHSHVIIRTSYGGFQVLNSNQVPMCGCWEINLRKVGEKKKESRGATSTLWWANKWASRAGRAGRAIPATLAPGNTDPRYSFILKVDRVGDRRRLDVISFSRWWSTVRSTIK